MKIFALLSVLALSACASGRADDDAEAVNGLLALGQNGQTIAFDNHPDSRLPITGSLAQASDGTTAIDLTYAGGLVVRGTLPAGADLTAAAPLAVATYQSDISSAVSAEDSVAFALGQTAGTIRLTEIVPQPGGYRVRGAFDARICPQDASDDVHPCFRLDGLFAFDQAELPARAVPTAIIQPQG